MTVNTTNSSDLFTSLGIGAISVIGALAKGEQWRDAKTGKASIGLLISGISAALIMATIVRAAGVHYGVEPWAQVAGSGVLCYVGPDPIIRAIAGMALKRFGVQENGSQSNADKPAA